MTSTLHDTSRLVYEIAAAPFIGVYTSASRFLAFFPDISPLSLSFLIMAIAVVLMIAFGIFLLQDSNAPASREELPPSFLSNFITPRGPTLVGFFIAYVSIWLFSYAFTFTNFPPTDEMGRQTAYHMAAAFPAAIFAALIWHRLLTRRWAMQNVFSRIACTLLPALYGGLLTSYLFTVQSGYAESWQIQKSFWKQVVSLCPELQPGVTVIIGGTLVPPSRFIQANSTQDYRLARGIFDWRSSTTPNFDKEPGLRVNVLSLQMRGKPYIFRINNSKLQFACKPWLKNIGWSDIDENNLILLKSKNGILRRVETLQWKGLPKVLTAKTTYPKNPSFSADKYSPFFQEILR